MFDEMNNFFPNKSAYIISVLLVVFLCILLNLFNSCEDSSLLHPVINIEEKKINEEDEINQLVQENRDSFVNYLKKLEGKNFTNEEYRDFEFWFTKRSST